MKKNDDNEKNNREFGGYIELETFRGNPYHGEALAFNSGRSCLAFLIENKNIKELYLPDLLCDSVIDVCVDHNVTVKTYHIDVMLKPILSGIPFDSNIYLVNYYGQLQNEDIMQVRNRCKYIIVDNVEDFFRRPIAGVDTIYSARKFFGVADGAYLYTDCKINHEYPRDKVNMIR